MATSPTDCTTSRWTNSKVDYRKGRGCTEQAECVEAVWRGDVGTSTAVAGTTNAVAGTTTAVKNGTSTAVVHTNANWDDAYWSTNKYGYWNGQRGYWTIVNGKHVFVVAQ